MQAVNCRVLSPAQASRQNGTILIQFETDLTVTGMQGLLVSEQSNQIVRMLDTWQSNNASGVVFSLLDTRDFEDGLYSLQCSVFDVQGDSSFAGSTFFIDNTPPAISRPIRIHHMLYGDAALPRSTSVGLYGAFNEPVTIQEARWINGKGSVVSTFSPESINLHNGELNGLLPLPTGNHLENVAQVRVRDEAGNLSSWHVSNSVRMTDHPTNPIEYKWHDFTFSSTDAATFRLEGLLWDSSGTFHDVEWRPVMGQTDWMKITDVSPVWHGYRWVLNVPLSDELALPFEIRARDRFGNVFSLAPNQMQRPLIPNPFTETPFIQLTAPDSVLYQDQSRVSIKGTVINPSEKSNLDWSLEVRSEESNNWSLLASGQTAEAFDSSLADWNLPSLDGVYLFRLQASNAFGKVETFRSVFVNATRWPDRDSDGLSDRVEFNFFGTLEHEADQDTDGDGILNRDELLLGFDPSDSRSFLKPIQRRIDGGLQLQWMNEGAIGYQVFRRKNANNGRWQKLVDLEAAFERVQTYELEQHDEAVSSFYLVRKTPDPLAHIMSLQLADDINLQLVKIPGGAFTMGSTSKDPDRNDDEAPLSELTMIEPFYMGKYEITQAQWLAVMQSNPSYRHGLELPLDSVSWMEAMEFCRRLTERAHTSGKLPLGFEYALPTEAQWEYACRAGSETRFYHGNDPEYLSLGRYAWYDHVSRDRTHPVGQKTPNDWGLHDMHGNVWEWCFDRYSSRYSNEIPADTDESNPNDAKVCRGGAWNSVPWFCRSANRNRNNPDERLIDTGFRVIITKAP